jgi:hypothetical protein
MNTRTSGTLQKLLEATTEMLKAMTEADRTTFRNGCLESFALSARRTPKERSDAAWSAVYAARRESLHLTGDDKLFLRGNKIDPDGD